MTTLLFQFAALLYVLVLPGTLLALQMGEDWPLPVRAAVGFTLSLLTMPMASFCAAWILGTNVNPVLVLSVATVANVAGTLVWWLRRNRTGGEA